MNIDFKYYFCMISYVFMLLYIPLALLVYTPVMYEINSNVKDVKISNVEYTSAYKNLISYYLHSEELNDLWNDKEKRHMQDVRTIYDILFILFIASIAILYRNLNKAYISQIVTNSYGVVIVLFGLMLLFFEFFWVNIFHPIMFSNDDWIINANDISYYIFPIEFFEFSLILMIVFFVAVNMVVGIRNDVRIMNLSKSNSKR